MTEKPRKKSANLVCCSKKILLVQPFSAAVECAFSLLNSGFADQQEQSLQDYIEASVMSRYNNH